MSRKRLAFVIAFGPEVRAFVHSGLLASARQHYDVVIVTSQPQSRAFEGLDVPVVPMPQAVEPPFLAMMRQRSRRARIMWLENIGRAGVVPQRLASPNGTKARLKRFFLKHRALPDAVRAVEKVSGRLMGTHADWAALYRQHAIDGVVLATYSAARVIPALQTAHNLGLKTFIVLNSWKDVFVNPTLHVLPDRALVWSMGAARQLQLANNSADAANAANGDDAGRFRVVGSLHFQTFFEQPRGVIDHRRFCERLGLNPERPFICYTAAAPTAQGNEESILACLLDAIRCGDVARQPQVVLRLNPMEDGSRFDSLRANYPELVVERPEWEWNKRDDWCCALRSDMDLWLSTVVHSALNISIASTVTLEFAAVGRPVINVCFDLPDAQPLERSNRRFWEADFYRDVRESGYAAPAYSFEEMIRLASQYLEGQKTPPPADGLFEARNAVERVVAAIDEVMA